jgi:hypothetical protein
MGTILREEAQMYTSIRGFRLRGAEAATLTNFARMIPELTAKSDVCSKDMAMIKYGLLTVCLGWARR